MATKSAVSALPKAPKINPDELQEQQLNGDVELVAANGDDDEYEIPMHEQHLIHVRLVVKTNNPGAKSYDVTNNVQQLSVVDFEQMEKSGSLDQFDAVEILHDPRNPARIKADAAGEIDTTAVNQVGPNKPIRSTQDAQQRYKEVVGEDAPSDKSFTELKEAIAYFESADGQAELAKTKADADKKTAAVAKAEADLKKATDAAQ